MSRSRKVVQYTMEGDRIRTYDSIREAQAYTGVTHISSVCRNRRLSDGGFRWSYEDEELAKLSEDEEKTSRLRRKRF